ncbi:hypothetical protein APSETT444_010780 [Aspergillus pseudonomiae]
MVQLNPAEGLNDLNQILLQHGIIQSAEMIPNKYIAAQLEAVVRESLFIFFKGSVGVSAGHCLHGLETRASILLGLLGPEQMRHIITQVQHNLTKQHVLESGCGFVAFVERAVSLQSFNEIREGGGKVLVLRVEHTTLHIQAGLQIRRGEGVDQVKGIIVGLLLHVNGHKTGLKVLSKEGSPLCDSPVDAGFDDGGLNIECIRDLTEQVQ